MQRRRRQSLGDTLLVWGFVLSFAGLMGAGCFEAIKLVSLVPAAFESSPGVLRNPMWASEEEFQPNQFGRGRMTPQQRRAQNGERAEEPER